MFKRGHFHFIALRIVGAVDGLSDNGSRAQYPYLVDLKRRKRIKTLPKALRTQALTALTSNFGLVDMVK